MRLVVTGAAGFLGRAVTARLLRARGADQVVLLDRVAPDAPADPRFSAAALDITDHHALREAVLDADQVIHLAAVPGGEAEVDYTASRRVNLEASLALLEILADAPRKRPRLVHASSIAVFGAPLPAKVTDETRAHPTMTYGAHKLMVETALANLVRIGRLDALALRLPGLAARPAGEGKLKSAFISDIFHALIAGEEFVVPMRANATVWLMSARQAADNLILAAEMRTPTEGTPRVMTLPALRVRVAELVTAIVHETGTPSRIHYRPDVGLEAQFGALPPLATPLAESLGFTDDGDLRSLVRTVLADLAGPGAGFVTGQAPVVDGRTLVTDGG